MALAMATLALAAGCVSEAPPNIHSQAENAAALAPLDWYIFHSHDMPFHPSADPEGAWSFEFPSSGHVGYVQTPFNATRVLHNVVLTFKVESEAAQYEVIASADRLPATVHLFFEIQNDDGGPNGRWWAGSSKYELGSRDNSAITIVTPLTPDQWTNVVGQSDPSSFYAALQNIGWIGVTFGGQFFFADGVALAGGSAKYILISLSVN